MLKKLLLPFFALLCFTASGQGIFQKPNNSYGTTSNRQSIDSTLYFPTGCGVPTDTTWLFSQSNPLNQKLKKAALYYDSCGHKIWIWDPHNQGWAGFSSGVIDTTSLSNRINGKLNTSDTALMLLNYARSAEVVANLSGAPGLLEDVAANRPVSAITGVLFLAVDTKLLYRYNGTSWDLIGGGGGSTIDTTSLSNRINLKIDSIRRKIGSDSVFMYYNGTKAFAFRDSIGTTSAYDSASSQGGGFHTQPYNDTRYLKKADSATAYSTVKRVADTAAALRAAIAALTGTDTTIFKATGASGLNPFTLGVSGGVNQINLPKYRDTSAQHTVYTPDSALAIADHDTTSANALQSKAQTDSMRANIYAKFANYFPLTGGTLTGTGGSGYLGLPVQSTSPTAQANVTEVFRDSAGGVAFRYPAGFMNALRALSAHTANRSYYFPDSSGTFALTPYVVQNKAGMTSITVGVYSARPAASNCQCLYIATDSAKSYYDNGAWITIGGGSGGGGGIAAAQVGFISTPPNQSLTYWYDSTWTTSTQSNSSVPYVASSVTATLATNSVDLTGSGNSASNQYYKNQIVQIEHITITQGFKINNTISSTTYGIGVGQVGGFPNYGKTDLTNTGTAGKSYIVLNGVTVATSTGALASFANGDSLFQTWTQMRDTLTYTIFDKTAGTSNSVTYIMANAFQTVGTNVAHAAAPFATFVLGGTYRLFSSRVTIQEPLNPALAVIGHSIAQGDFVGTSWDNRYSDRLNANFVHTANFGSSGELIDNVIARMKDFSIIRPRQAILHIGCNDLRIGRTLPQVINDFANLTTQLEQNGTQWYIICTPETTTNGPAVAQMDSFFRATYPNEYINVYDTIATNTASFLTSDGIHLTAAGAAAVYTKIVASGKVVANIYVPSFHPKMPGAAITTGNNTFMAGQTIDGSQTETNNAGLTITNSLVAPGSQPALSLTPKWNTNASAVAFMMNVTNTASGAGSNLMDLQVGGASKFKADIAGDLILASGAYIQGLGAGITIKNNTTSFTSTTASLYGTNDAFLQMNPGGSGYGVFESAGGLGIFLSTQGGANPIKFAPNRTVTGLVFGNGNFAANFTADSGASVLIGPATTTRAGLYFRGSSTPPTSLKNGYMWVDTTSSIWSLNFRANGVTTNLLAGGGTNYQTVQSNTSSQTQRAKLNFGPEFTTTDNSGNGSTDITSPMPYVMTTDASAITNTTTPGSLKGTGFGSLTFPANYFTVGKTITLKLRGLLSTDVTNTGVLGFNFSTSNGSYAFSSVPDASLSNQDWDMEVICVCRAIGASGTGSINVSIKWSIGSKIYYATETAVNFATTSSQTFDLTSNWAQAISGNSIQCKLFNFNTK